MSRKNAFLFILLLSTSSTQGLFNFKQGTIAKYEVLASVILASLGVRCLLEAHDTKNATNITWKEAFKDPVISTEVAVAAVSMILSGLVFNNACERLNINY